MDLKTDICSGSSVLVENSPRFSSSPQHPVMICSSILSHGKRGAYQSTNRPPVFSKTAPYQRPRHASTLKTLIVQP